jgi:hypothetical protein
MSKLITLILVVVTLCVATISQLNVSTNAKSTSTSNSSSISSQLNSSSSDSSKSTDSSNSSTSALTSSITSKSSLMSSTVSSDSSILDSKTKKAKKTAKLKLDGTHPKFLDKTNPEVNEPMQSAVLKALKKWKGELPINNTFTITSWANLKSSTVDSNSQARKKKDTTPNSWVIYMWSQTPNSNWPKNKVPTDEDMESGDPRILRTEFNVLLKQDSKGNFKATIENDQELQVESAEVIESDLDTKIHQDLFQLNNTNNKFTATEEVIQDEENNSSSLNSVSSSLSSSSVSISSSSSIQNSLAVSSVSNFSNSSLNSNNSNSSKNTNNLNSSSYSTVSNSSVLINSTSSILSQNSSVVSSNSNQTVSFWEKILSFGSVQASAGENDYSWPWKKGDTWGVHRTRNDFKCSNSVYGWHGCGEYSMDGNGNPALDLWPPSNSDYKIYAPITGTINRVCYGTQNLSFAIGNMRILHISNSNFIGQVNVTKSQHIGNFETMNSGYFGDSCGSSQGIHTHIKFIANDMNVDGQVISHYGSYSSFTSQNSSTPPFNNQTGMIRSSTNSNFVFDVDRMDPTNQNKVQLWGDNGSMAQKWGYTQFIL